MGERRVACGVGPRRIDGASHPPLGRHRDGWAIRDIMHDGRIGKFHPPMNPAHRSHPFGHDDRPTGEVMLGIGIV